jgi:hypothetical protein
MALTVYRVCTADGHAAISEINSSNPAGAGVSLSSLGTSDRSRPCVVMNSGASLTRRWLTPVAVTPGPGGNPATSTPAAGCRLRVATLPTTASEMIRLMTGATNDRLILRLETDGSLSLINSDASSTVLAATAAGCVVAGSWHEFSMAWTIHNTTGTFDLFK